MPLFSQGSPSLIMCGVCYIKTWVKAVPLGIIALDFGGVVDTLAFNNRGDLPSRNSSNESKTRQALELVKAGIARKDPVLLGRGATLSALTNQGILHKPRLEELIDFAMSHGAYGVNVAHSGTVAGVLVPPGRESDTFLVKSIAKHFPAVRQILSPASGRGRTALYGDDS
ncbi:MAG: hypothetical protein RQM95_04950 [Syntrophaceticus schinkii]